MGKSKRQPQEKTVTDSYLEFIDKMAEVGKEARSEQSYCDFTDDDEETAKESIEHYKKQLIELQIKLTVVEKKAKETFNWE